MKAERLWSAGDGYGGRGPRRGPSAGFSLVELMVSATVLLIMLGIAGTIMGNSSELWLKQRNKAMAFEAAHTAFETLTRSLAQANLATYWGYDNPARPTRYTRESELHFTMGQAASLLSADPATYPSMAVFFQAPLGRPAGTAVRRLPSLLNSVGYFVHFGDMPDVPEFLRPLTPARHRFRLYEWIDPVEDVAVYRLPGNEWFRSCLTQNTAVLAENIAGLIMFAEYPDGQGNIRQQYVYDSRNVSSELTLNQLPPRLRVLMVAITEASAEQLARQYGSLPPPVTPPSHLFQDPSLFDSDMAEWNRTLDQLRPKVDYTVLVASVGIQNAKWSR